MCPQVRGTKGLRRVFDNQQAMPAGDFHEMIHTAEATVQMHWHDGPRPRSYGLLDEVHVHVVIIPHVNENNARTDVVDGRHGCDEGMGDRDDLIPRPNTSRFQDQAKAIGAVADTDGVLGSFDTGRVQSLIDDLKPVFAAQNKPIKDGITPANLETNQFLNPALKLP